MDVKLPISHDLSAAHDMIFTVYAMVQGTSALLEKVEHIIDSSGSIFGARTLSDATLAQLVKMMAAFDDNNVLQRVQALELSKGAPES